MPMRLIPCIPFTLAVAICTAPVPASAGNTVPMQSRPHTMRCLSTVNAWLEVDGSSLPKREHAYSEAKKRVQLSLIGSSPSRGESVVCSYASRSRDITTSYSERCVYPRKVRGYRHTYSCK